jgi:hypothetical protein
MKKFVLLTGILLAAFPLSAQEVTLPDLAGFKKVTNYPVFTPDNLWDFINGAADNYLAYGFADLHVAEYKKGKEVIKLEVYRHKNNILAFGIYSSERSPSFNFLKLGAQGYNAGGSTNFFKGSHYVKIRTYSKKDKTLQSAALLARQMAEMITGESSVPAALSLFPAEGRKVNEETFINESVLGHSFLNNAFKATYQSGSDEYSVFLFEKGSAAETLESVNAWFREAKMDIADEDNGKVVINDGYNGTVFLAWKGSRMVAISGLAKDQSNVAEKYTSAILK